MRNHELVDVEGVMRYIIHLKEGETLQQGDLRAYDCDEGWYGWQVIPEILVGTEVGSIDHGEMFSRIAEEG